MTMRSYAARRILIIMPTLLGATALLFTVMRVLPGDVALVILVGHTGEGSAPPDQLEALRAQLGTDRPILEQYFNWLRGVITLDLGRSLISGVPVGDAILTRFQVTFQIAVLSTLGTALIGIPLGVVMAVRQETKIDYLLRIVTIGGQAIPVFFTATLVIMVLATQFRWMPSLDYVGFFVDPVRNLSVLMWPVLILAWAGAVVIARMTRSTLLDVLRQEYIVTARSKGLSTNVVTFRHALRNAGLPILALLGVTFVGSLNGTVVLEHIFSIPGIGSALVTAVADRDYPMIEGTVLAILIIVLLANLVLDLMNRLLDPRVSFS